MSWLDGRVALVTGGGSGMGRAVVERFVDEGARVGVFDLSAERLASLEADLGDDVVAVQGDVTDLSDNRLAVSETVEAFGQLDVFVGNAGIFDNNINVAELDENITESFQELFTVNVLGYILGAKAALPELVETEGRMVFTASGASFRPDGGGIFYVPSKHAVAGLIRQLAFELAPTVSVNGVALGYVPTELTGVEALDQGKGIVEPEEFDPSLHPLQIVPTPEDYTGPYVLLASEENSRPMTGSIITADLGRSVRGIGELGGRALEYITADVDR